MPQSGAERMKKLRQTKQGTYWTRVARIYRTVAHCPLCLCSAARAAEQASLPVGAHPPRTPNAVYLENKRAATKAQRYTTAILPATPVPSAVVALPALLLSVPSSLVSSDDSLSQSSGTDSSTHSSVAHDSSALPSHSVTHGDGASLAHRPFTHTLSLLHAQSSIVCDTVLCHLTSRRCGLCTCVCSPADRARSSCRSIVSWSSRPCGV